MNAEALVYVFVVGTLLAGIAACLEAVFRLTKRPARFVWLATLCALAGLSLFPLASSRGPQPFRVVVSSSGTSSAALAADRQQSAVEMIRSAAAFAGRSLNATIAAVAAAIPHGVGKALAALSLSSSAILMLLVVVINVRAHKAVHAMPQSSFDDTTLRIADVGPAVIGLVDPAIVIPQWLFTRSLDEQRLVIAHERQHLLAHDQFLPVVGWMCVALVPWHPAAWWMLSRLRLAIELDCDARVLRSTQVSSRKYGELLIDIAGIGRPTQLGALALADQPSHLERRLSAMINKHEKLRGTRAATLCGAALLALAVACEARMPTAADVENMDISSATRAIQPFMKGSPDEGAVYFVNGNVMDADKVRRMAPSEIASVSIEKRADGEGKNIRIITTSVAPASASLQAEMAQIHGGEMSGARAAGSSVPVVNDSESFARVERMRAGTATQQDFAEAKQNPLGFKADFPGLIIINGVESTSAALAALTRESIQSVDIFKGASAAKMSDNPRAAYGIIRIVTK